MKKLIIISLLLSLYISCDSFNILINDVEEPLQTTEPETEPDQDENPPAYIEDHNRNSRGIYFGAAVNPDYLTESLYKSTLTDNFNTIVIENDMKFSYLQPSEGNFNFSKADTAVDYAVETGMSIRGHVLLWHNDHQIPNWLKSKNYSKMQNQIETHIENVMTHYSGKIYAWDVANEIFLDNAQGLRNRNLSGEEYSVWANSNTDDSVIRAAFYKADEVRKDLEDDVKLFLCDYSNETLGHAKADLFYSYVESWVNDGVPIDGVGFQMHLDGRYTPDYSNIRANIDRYHALGLEVQFTEIDIRMDVSDGLSDDELNIQADIYEELMNIVIEKDLDTYITWGITDKYSWIPYTFSGMGGALMFDEEYTPKKCFDKVITLIE